MKLYGAIDLHSNNNVTVLIDEQDQVVYQKRLPNDLPLITQQLSGYLDRLQGIVVESTYNWYWLVDGLMDQNHDPLNHGQESTRPSIGPGQTPDSGLTPRTLLCPQTSALHFPVFFRSLVSRQTTNFFYVRIEMVRPNGKQ
jgi:hypothetical protein